ncbi:MAG: O-antigen ligase family protein [Acidobacteriota bacterium]
MSDPEIHTEIAPWFEAIEIGKRSSATSKAIFVLLCATLMMTTLLFGAVDHATWVILSFTGLAIAAFWLYDAWRARAFLLDANILLVPLGALIGIGIIQLLPLFSPILSSDLVPNAPRSAISLDPYSTRLFIVRLVIYLVFFAAALTFVNSKPRLKKAVIGIICFGSLMAIFAILQRLAHVESIYGMRDTPQAIPFGPFVNQHHFAAFMEMTGGVTLAFLFAAGARREVRIVLGLAAVVMGIAVVMTSSRGGLISFVGVMLFTIAASNFVGRRSRSAASGVGGQQKLALAAAAIALIVLIVGSVLFLGADSSLVRGIGLASSGDITNGRTHFWAIALRIFADHPLFGAGLDAFGSAFTKYDSWPGTFRVEQAHNDYLQTLADAGIAGFACIAAFIYFLFKKGLTVITSTGDEFRRCSAIGALAGCFGIVIHSFFDFPLRTPSNAFFFLMLAAIAVVGVKSQHRQRTVTGSSLRPHGSVKVT